MTNSSKFYVNLFVTGDTSIPQTKLSVAQLLQLLAELLPLDTEIQNIHVKELLDGNEVKYCLTTTVTLTPSAAPLTITAAGQSDPTITRSSSTRDSVPDFQKTGGFDR